MVAKTKGYEAIQYLTSTDFQKSKWSKEQHEIYKSAIREFQLAPQIDVDISEIYTSPSYAEKLRQTEMLIDAGYDANFVGVSQKVKDRFTPILETMFATGGRAGDVSNIRVKDINFEDGYIKLEKAKFGKKRVVALPDHLAEILKKQIANKKGTDLLFPSPSNPKKATTVDSINKYIDDVSVKYGNINPNYFSAKTVDPDLIAAGFDEKTAKNAKSHTFRKIFATLLSEKNFDPAYIKEVLGHDDEAMSFFYIRAKKLPKEEGYQLTERMISTLQGNANFNNKMSYVMEAVRNNKVEETFRKKIETNKSVNSEVVSKHRKQREAVESAYVKVRKLYNERGIGSGSVINKNVLPEFMSEEEATQFYRDQDLIEPDKVKAPVTKEEPKVFTDKNVTLDRAKRINYLSGDARGYANAKMSEDMISVYNNLKNSESASRVKANISVFDAADQVVESVFNNFDIESYRETNSNFMQETLMSGQNFNYDPEDLYDLNVDPKAKKAGMIWDDIPYLADMFGKTSIENGKPVIKLDQDILRDILELMEQRKREDSFAKTLIDQLEYATFPEESANDAYLRYRDMESSLKASLEKYGKQNPNLAVAFNSQQGYIPDFTERVMKNLPNVLHEKEYTGISNLDLIAIVEKRSPKLSDEIKKVFMLNKPGAEMDLIHEMLLEPYKQFLYQNDLLDDVVFLKDSAEAESAIFEKPLKERINLKKNGLPSKNQKAITLGLRIKTDITKFQEALPPSSAGTFAGEGDNAGKRIYLKKPFVNFTDENDRPVAIEKPKQLGPKIAEEVTKKVDWSKLKLPSIIAGYGLVASNLIPTTAAAKTLAFTGKVLVEGTLETALVDPDAIGKGVLGKPLFEDKPEYFSANPNVVRRNLDEMTPEEVAKVVTTTPEPDSTVTFMDMFKEKGKELGRFAAAAGSAIASPQARQNLFTPTVEALDTKEAQSQEASDLIDNISRREIQNYVPAQQQDLDRRRENFSKILEEYPGAKGDPEKQIRRPRLEKIEASLDAQMGNLNLSTNQEGENNAVNERLQTRRNGN